MARWRKRVDNNDGGDNTMERFDVCHDLTQERCVCREAFRVKISWVGSSVWISTISSLIDVFNIISSFKDCVFKSDCAAVNKTVAMVVE